MKKSLLFMALSVAQLSFAQVFPTPVYKHTFTNTLNSPSFSTGTGSWLTADRHNTSQRACKLDAGHGAVTLDIQDNKAALQSAGTISFWYKFAGVGNSAFGSDKPLVFWSNGGTSYSEGMVLAMNEYGNVKVISYQAQSIGGSNSSPVTAGTDGNWHHFAVSWKFGSGGFIKGYVDGDLVAEKAISHSIPNASNFIFFTGFNGSYPSSHHGDIDDIKVYTEVLSDGQIDTLHTSCAVNFLDANFKNAVLYHNPVIDEDGDGVIQCIEAAAYTGTLNVSNQQITDLTGIEEFKNITTLDCKINQLTSIDISHNLVLEEFICRANNLTTLDISANTSLTYVNCSYNSLTSLNINGATSLEDLVCYNNELASLDLSNNPNMKYLICYENKLTSLNLANGNNPVFERIEAQNNPDLTCIKVDDEAYSNTNWTVDNYFEKPQGAIWSEDCSSAPMGVAEISTNDISVYPNPTNGITHISEEVSVQVYDMSGRLMLQKDNVNAIDLSNLMNGVYILKTQNGNGTGVTRIIKK